jgi:hypothetical protein
MNTEETGILEVADRLAKKHKCLLEERGLSISDPELEVWDSSVEFYRSELRIKVFKGGYLHDTLEFEIFRNGQCLLSRKDVGDWLDEQL